MTDTLSDRRENHVLRRHIDCLLSSGASLTGRLPITIAFHDCTITVRNGKLFSENGLRKLVAVIASHVWPSRQLRNIAIEICLGQLDARDDGFGKRGTPSVQDVSALGCECDVMSSLNPR